MVRCEQVSSAIVGASIKNGMIAESYPGQIFNCYKIQVIGEANVDETADALNRYMSVHTIENTIYYVDNSDNIVSTSVEVTFGDYFSEWKKLNNIPNEVVLLKISSEDNAFDETNGEMVVHYTATIRDYYLDLSEEFLTYLSSANNEEVIVESLVKTIIGDNPSAPDTAVYLTVNGSPLQTDKNDFGKRLKFNMQMN